MESFAGNLERRGLSLTRGNTVNLQVNLGLRCNQRCDHCRLDAGPERAEMMASDTMDEVLAYAGRCRYETVDVTGGAPELHPRLETFIARLAPLAGTVRLRTNLTALLGRGAGLMAFLRDHRVALAASFPSLEQAEAEGQRGAGTFRASLECLGMLNALGYGRDGSGLELDLVTNPSAAVIPSLQVEQEGAFRDRLGSRWGIAFNRLFSFTNVPLGRFRAGLVKSGELREYLEVLAASFNPDSLPGLMCRDTVAVDWNGWLFDCDFNLPTKLFQGGVKRHVSGAGAPPEAGSPIALGNHCYACTAGAGFT